MQISISTYDHYKFSIMLCFALSLLAFAQPPDTIWQKTYGGVNSDGGRTVIQTSDQGYLIAGWTWSFGPGRNDIFLVKTTNLGDTLWTRVYGSLFSDSYASAIEVNDTNYVVAYTRGLTTGNADIGLLKTNSCGDTLWTKYYGSMTVDGCYDLQPTPDSGFILVGWTYSGGGGANVLVIKTNASGDTLWTRTYGGTGDDYGYSIVRTSDQGYIIAGYTNSYGAGNYDIYIIKTDVNGDTIWTGVLGGSADDFGYEIIETSDSNYVVAGASWSYGPGAPDSSNLLIVTYNPSGDTIWTRIFGGPANDRAYSLKQTLDNNIIIAGSTNSYGVGGFDIYLVKIDLNGDTLWTTTYGAADYDHGYSIVQNQDTGYTIVGSTLSYGAGDYDVILIKTEPDLKILENKYIEKQPNKINIYPNPFTHKVDIYMDGNDHQSCIKIYDITGRMIKKFNPSTNQVSWSGDDERGNILPSGIYILIYQQNGLFQTRIMTLVR